MTKTVKNTRKTSRKTVNLADAVDTLHAGQAMSLRELVKAYDARHPGKEITHHLAGWLQDLGDRDAWAITTGQLKKGCRVLLDGDGYSPGYVNRQMSALGSAYKWADEKEIAPRGFVSPTIGIRRKPETIRRVTCSAKEAQRLRDGSHGHRDRRFALFVNLMLDTGARPSELNERRWNEIDLDRREIVLEDTKTGKPRVLFFSEDTAALARRLRPADRTHMVFSGRRGTPTKFRKPWLKLVADIGRPDLRVYDMRHIAAARLLRNGTTTGVASQVMGHSSLILHTRYGHLESAPLRAAQETAWTHG